MEFEIVTSLVFLSIAVMCLSILVIDKKTKIKISGFDYLAITLASIITSTSLCFLGLVFLNF